METTFFRYAKTAVLVAAVALGGVFAYRQFSGGGKEEDTAKPDAVAVRKKADGGIRKSRRQFVPKRKHGNRLKAERVKAVQPLSLPEWALKEIEEEKNLATTAEKVIARLQAYLESDDFKKLSPDRQKAFHMRHALDGGDREKALRMARELMDSDDIAVREAALGAFGWAGTDAMPELAEMAMDDDAQIAAEAMKKFLESIEEIPEEAERADLIKKMMPTLTTVEEVDSLLMELTRMESKTAMHTVVDVIEGGTELSDASARDMYRHLTGGEVYEDADQAEVVLERMLRLESGESYTKVMIETGGEVSEAARALYEATGGTMKLPDGSNAVTDPTAVYDTGVKK